MTGRFIVIEGPNGVGKTTVAARLAADMRRSGTTVDVTREPSGTALGNLVRSAESRLSGRALALAVAADRHAHLQQEVVPALDHGHDVISDRYVQSSLVLQRIDGLSLADVWAINAQILVPHLSVYLNHDAAVIAARLAERPALSRLEIAGSPERELALYRDACRFLEQQRWPQLIVNCQRLDPAGISNRITDHLSRLHGRKSA